MPGTATRSTTLRQVQALAAVVLVALLNVALASTSDADGGVFVGSTEVTAERSADGVTAKVAVTNATTTRLTVKATAATAGCVPSVTDDGLERAQTTTVKLTFGGGCFVGKQPSAESVQLRLTPDSVTLPAVTVKAPPGAASLQPLLSGGIAAGVGALLIVLSGWLSVAVAKKAAKGAKGENRKAYKALGEVIEQRLTQLGGGGTWKEFHQNTSYGFSSPIRGLKADWSIGDSWVSTITAAATALVTLLSSTDLFSSVVGAKPDGALSVVVVASLGSAMLLALALLVVRLFGKSATEVTVGGLILSDAMVAAAVALEVTTVTCVAITELKDQPVMTDVALGAAALTAAILLGYLLKRQHRTLADGFDTKLPSLPESPETRYAATEEWQKPLVVARLFHDFKDWLELPAADPDNIGGLIKSLDGHGTTLWREDPRTASMP